MSKTDDSERRPPRVRKKKKKKPQESSRWPLRLGLAGAGVVALALVIWLVVKLTSGAPPAQPVTAWKTYISEENEFGFEYPADWKAKSYGIRDRREAEVTGSSARITVKQNLAGSVVADIADAADRGKPVDDEHSPVAKVHALRCPQESSSYKEEAAVTVLTKMGKGRRSVYTDGSRRGYRATVLLHRTALDVFCECRESDWDTLRPAFEHVIESLVRGGGL
jgi:hypothetical protein